jgi:hypothetical protein
MEKFKIRRGAGLDLLPTDFHRRSDPEKNSILSGVFGILNDSRTILSLVYQPLPAAQFAQGSIPGVGVASKDTHGKTQGGEDEHLRAGIKSSKSKKHKKTRKKRRRSKKKRKRSKRRSR